MGLARILRGLSRLASLPRRTYHRCRGVTLGRGAAVGRHCRLSRGVVLGPGVVVENFVQIEGQVSIGADSRIEMAARIFGRVTIGEGCLISRDAYLGGNIDIGDKSTIGYSTTLTTSPTATLKIGRDVMINCLSVLGADQRLEIGDHGIFAPFVQITDAAHGYEDPAAIIKDAPTSAAPVILGENVWLGSGVMIMKGVTIGAGAVIGAKALVSSDVPPGGIAVGIPARVIRQRQANAQDAAP
jgi:acetyltransferase-like isoleucine patch superfamily enzyme